MSCKCNSCLHMTLGELCGAPAGDGRAHELLGGHEECEGDEDDDGELTAEAVRVVVIATRLQLLQGVQRLEQAIHGGRGLSRNFFLLDYYCIQPIINS